MNHTTVQWKHTYPQEIVSLVASSTDPDSIYFCISKANGGKDKQVSSSPMLRVVMAILAHWYGV